MKILIEMKNVIPIETLNIHQVIRRQLPATMLDFLDLFLKRLSSVLGVSFLVDASSSPAVLRKLQYLRSVGIIKGHYKVRREPFDEPPVFGVQVNLVGDKRTGYSGYGRSYSSYEEAYGPAYGEALERWCVETFSPSVVKSLSLTELGSYGLYINSLPGPDRKALSSRPEKDYDIHHNSSFLCIPVKDLTAPNREIYAPLQWFSFKHGREYLLTGREPQIHPLITTGAAAGTSYEAAVLGGIYEALERDAFMLYWLKRITPGRIDVSQFDSPNLRKLKEWTDRYQLEAHFLYMPTDFSVHTVLCMVVDKSGWGPAVVVDASTDTNLVRCLEKSFISAVNQRPYMRRKWKEFADREMESGELYIETRPFWWYQTDKLPLIDFLLQGPVLETFPSYEVDSLASELDMLIGEFNDKNYPVLCTSILPEVHQAHLGDFVVSIKIPELVPMHLNEWEKSVTGTRLDKVPLALGLVPGTDGINDIPHPFS